MTATMVGLSKSASLFDSSYMVEAPHVHLHFLTNDEESVKIGFDKVEVCCHGCGASLLIYFDDASEQDAVDSLAARDAFTAEHRNCTNRGYEHTCPSYRSSVKVLDLRRVIMNKKTPANSGVVHEHLRGHPHGRREHA